MAHRIQLVPLFALLGACGISVVGVDPSNVELEGGVPLVDGAVATNDASTNTTDGGAPSGPVDCSTTTCPGLALAAAGFTLIGFGASSDVCPSGFDSTDGFGDPNAKGGSCGCAACTTTGSNCSTGNIPSSQSNDTQCDNFGAPFPSNDGKCKAYSNYWGSTYGGVGVPTAVVGTCHADGQVVRDNIDAAKSRICTPQPGICPAAFCSLKGKLDVCLVAPGDVACPAAAPKKTVIGDLQASCPACSCTPAAKCDGRLHWWEGSTSCAGPESGTVPANVCTKVNGKSIKSILWEPVVTESCSAVTPAPQATVTRDNLRTVCCPG